MFLPCFGSDLGQACRTRPNDTTDNAAGTWKTILVGGLNHGGKGYYALDITTPAAPKGLWEFKLSSTCFDPTDDTTIAATAGADCHIGESFGNPIISKLADGTWVVMFTSGYNNVNSPVTLGDGKGYLYVLDAGTGLRSVSAWLPSCFWSPG